MALTTHRWTRADIDRMPDDGNRYEVVDGELLVTPPPSPAHELLHHFIARRLQPYLDANGLGLALDGKPAVIFDDSHVEPDLIVSATVIPPPAEWAGMPQPILIVEVLSPSTARRDQVAKRDLYVRSGIPTYWVVDGESRTVRVVDGSGDCVESEEVRWHPAGARDAFHLELPSLFDQALGTRK